MLTELLKHISRGELRSQVDIARQMGVPPGMISVMVSQLARQGYLEEMSPGCTCRDETPKSYESTCTDCPTQNGCNFEAGHMWSLTEKGKRAAAL